MSSLAVLLGEPPSSLVRKGELIPRYYNPGNVFDRLHFVVFAPEAADPEALVPHLKAASGNAEVEVDVVRLPDRLFATTLGLRPALLASRLSTTVDAVSDGQPDLIRAYANGLHAFVGALVSEQQNIPFVVSLHINPDVDLRGRARFRHDPREALVWQALQSVEARVMRQADRTIAVYRPILPYVRRLGARRVDLIYNAVNGEELVPRTGYSLHDPPQLLCVGRQFREKNPENILRGLRRLRDRHQLDARVTLVGDGPLHARLVETAREEGVSDAVRFERGLPNRDVCRLLSSADIYVAHSEYWEVSKPVLEASLLGLPIVLNRRTGSPVPEYESGWVHLVDDTPDAYADALAELLTDTAARESRGRRARAFALENWDPARMERRVADLYEELVGD